MTCDGRRERKLRRRKVDVGVIRRSEADYGYGVNYVNPGEDGKM